MIIKVTAATGCSFIISGVKPDIRYPITAETRKKDAEAIACILANELSADTFNHVIANLIEMRDERGPLCDSEVFLRCEASAKELEV
jgi:hypothetical protein